jgi:hypothetical protein
MERQPPAFTGFKSINLILGVFAIPLDKVNLKRGSAQADGSVYRHNLFQTCFVRLEVSSGAAIRFSKLTVSGGIAKTPIFHRDFMSSGGQSEGNAGWSKQVWPAQLNTGSDFRVHSRILKGYYAY